MTPFEKRAFAIGVAVLLFCLFLIGLAARLVFPEVFA